MSVGQGSAPSRPRVVFRRLAVALGGGLALGTVVSISVLVVRRILAGGVQQYGCDGAPYIEHVARLQVVQVVRDGSWLTPFRTLVDADGAFPPGMHLATLPVGAIFGHGSDVALLTGPFWLVVLALAVGVVTFLVAQGRGQGPQDSRRESLAGLAAFCLVPLFPAVHGFATRYYYDLPMTALIWLSVATLLALRPRRPFVAGLLAGLVLALASLVKWSALPFGLTILVGAAYCGRSTDASDDGVLAPVFETTRRTAALVLAVAVATGLSLAYLAASGSSNSYRQMSWETFEGVEPGPGLPPALAGILPEFLNSLAMQTVAGWTRLELSDLAFYPSRLAFSALSPGLAIVCLLAIGFWWARDRRGWPLLAAVLLGHGLLLVLVIPRLDDRFLLPGLPLLALVLGCAWSRSHIVLRWLLLPAVVGLGLAVAWDFHEGIPSSWTEPRLVLDGRGDVRPSTMARGWGAASSVQRLGWVRHDEEGSARTAFRDGLWDELSRCRSGRLAELDERPMLGGCGNRFWWEYRGDLDQLQGGAGRLPFVSGYVWQIPPGGGGTSSAPDLLVVGQEPEGGWRLPAGLEPGAWELWKQVADPEGGAGAALWTQLDRQPCDMNARIGP